MYCHIPFNVRSQGPGCMPTSRVQYRPGGRQLSSDCFQQECSSIRCVSAERVDLVCSFSLSFPTSLVIHTFSLSLLSSSLYFSLVVFLHSVVQPSHFPLYISIQYYLPPLSLSYIYFLAIFFLPVQRGSPRSGVCQRGTAEEEGDHGATSSRPEGFLCQNIIYSLLRAVHNMSQQLSLCESPVIL